MTKTVNFVYIVYRKEGESDMVFKEEAYKEVFPDVVVTPVAPKQESMINDQDDENTVEPKQVEQEEVVTLPVEPKQAEQETMLPDQKEGAE